jgi:hypothetical protein
MVDAKSVFAHYMVCLLEVKTIRASMFAFMELSGG